MDKNESNADIASCTAAATASPAPESPPPSPVPDSRIRRAVRHTGHHAHSGASPEASAGGVSVVAVFHTSPVSARLPPKALRNWSPTSLRTF